MKICTKCEGTNFVDTELDFPIASSSVRSVRVKAQKCTCCGEPYINIKEVQAIEEISKALNEISVGA